MATIDIFDTYLKAEATKKSYRLVWNLFLKFHKSTDNKILKLTRKQQEQKIIEYVNFLKEDNKAPSTIKIRLNVFEFVFSMHDIVLNWKKLKKMVPEKVKPAGGDTWSDQEIREMIKAAGTVRNTAIIYFFASVGCRITAMTEVKLKDLEDFEDCICVMIYSGYPEEYPAFLTPEATKMVKHYLKIREERGENLGPESPLFASEKVVFKTDEIEPITNQAIKAMLIRIYSKFPNSRVKQGHNRYNIQVTHGFRKWQATKLKLKIDVHHSISERLLGHKAGLDSNYFITNSRESKLQLFEAFKKCIPDLTLDKSQMIEKVDDFRKELQELKKMNEELQKRNDKLIDAWKSVASGIEQGNPFAATADDD